MAADEPTKNPDDQQAESDEEQTDEAAEARAESVESDSPDEPVEISRGDGHHNYHYATAEISERGGFIPIWLVLTVLFFVTFGVVYAIHYWNVKDPLEPISGQQQTIRGVAEPSTTPVLDRLNEYVTVESAAIACVGLAILIGGSLYALRRRRERLGQAH